MPLCFAKCWQVCYRANPGARLLPTFCPGQIAQGRELCVPEVALEPMTTTTSPYPRRAPGPHPHLETSGRSAADTREATAAAIAARETPQVSGTPSPCLGVPLPLTLAVLLAPPRPEGTRLLPPSAGLAPPRRSLSLPWPARQESVLREPGRPSLASLATILPTLAKGGEGRKQEKVLREPL